MVAHIENIGDLRMMFVLYGLAFGTLSLCLAALYHHASRAAVLPPLEPQELAQTRREVIGWCYRVLVAIVSMACAWILPESPPPWLTGMPGMVYLLLAFSGLVARRFGPR